MPIKQSVTLDETICVLNRALQKDRDAISKLFLRRKVKCNDELADDETIQVGKRGNSPTIGPIGILNGLFGIDDDMDTGYGTCYGAIGARVGDDGNIVTFEKVDHGIVYERIRNNAT